MNEILQNIYDEARSAWRFRWIGLATAAVIAVTGWLMVFTMPDRYEAAASVFVDTRTALRPALQGLTVEQDVNVQLNRARQSLLSGERLERIARSSGVLAAHETDQRRIAGILEAFAGRVQVDVRSAGAREHDRDAGSIYSFRYQDGNRDQALRVTQTLLDVFVEETLGAKREGAEITQNFLLTELQDLERRLKAAEDRRAEFRKENIGLMPAEEGDYFTQLETTVDDARRVENDLNVAQAQRAELSRQLRGETVIAATAVTSAGAAGGTDTVSRINQTQAELDQLLLKYTDMHPRVAQVRENLAELKARREREIEQLRQGDASVVAATGISTNPVYQRIQQDLNQLDVQIASLRGQLAQHRQRATELRQRLDVAPKVAAEYSQLSRDYDTIKSQYDAMLANFERAKLGERADDAGSVKFDIVQPVTAAYTPVSPRRTFLLVVILAAGLVVGGTLSYLLQALRPVVNSVRSLAELTDLPLLGVVSGAFPRARAAEVRVELLRFAGAGSMLIVAFCVVLVLNALGIRLPGTAE